MLADDRLKAFRQEGHCLLPGRAFERPVLTWAYLRIDQAIVSLEDLREIDGF
jgi:hypothetical protein